MPGVGLLSLGREICPSIQGAHTAETAGKSIIYWNQWVRNQMYHDKSLKSQNWKNSLCLKSCFIYESQKVNLKVHKILLIWVIQSARWQWWQQIYPMNIWLKDPPTLLGWNLIRSISISTNPCREALIQSIVGSSGLVLNLKPNWPLSQPQGYSKKMREIYPSIRSDIKVMR